jgi:hypothetical protein
MREILFRGKSKDNGAWVYGSYISPPDTAFIVGRNTKKSEMAYDAVISETVGQYTGLKDKKGVKVFEGDILKSDSFSYLLFVTWSEQTGRGIQIHAKRNSFSAFRNESRFYYRQHSRQPETVKP